MRRTRRPPAGPNTSAPVRPSFGRTTEICVPSWWASLATRSPLSSSISSPPSRRLEGARPRRPSRALRCCSVGGRGDSAGETTRARTGGFRGPAGARRCSASLRGGVCSRTADQGGGARGALARSLSRLAHDSSLDAEAEKRQHRGEKLALLRKLVARDAPHADRHRDERGHAAAPVMDASASPVPAAAYSVALPPAQPQWRAYPAPPYAIAPPLAAMPPPPSPMVTYGQCPAVAHFGYAYPSQ